MKTFENINFKGTFRDYQARVIDKLDDFFHDQKINIVAAPGSGKTILGLEIIRKLNSACIVFSPTTTIRNQWGDRFKEMFLPEGEKAEDYISFDLNNIKPITSITYQALYSAIKKIKTKTEDEEIDYSYVDLFKLIKENNILTICLDEAHHLQNEWQKALEQFVKGLDSNIKIISLTATPPYDASPAEWQRYTDICGEIDEEIFVPELVKQNNLCPHQDYIYFNFPTKEEIQEIETYKQNVSDALETLKELDCIKNLPEKLLQIFKKHSEIFYDNTNEYVAVLSLLNHFGFKPSKRIVNALTTKAGLPNFDVKQAETAVRFLAGSVLLFDLEERESISEIFKSQGLVDKGKIELDLNERLRKKLMSSMGKLESIKQIARCEYENMGESLRMLVLTDFIKKEGIKNIGTTDKFNHISVLSIFESIRRENLPASLAVVSGSLVILPGKCIDEIKKNKKAKFKSEKIANTEHYLIDFNGSNREKVEIVGDLFENGFIQILVGTKSLLGEGWDSPCINSLVLASFVGSFMLSNQMRGRAIRIDKKVPNKTANIWHLVTVESVESATAFSNNLKQNKNANVLESHDYETLKRRFNSFVGPDYSTNEIVSGINRIKLIKPPFDALGIENINKNMETLSADRANLESVWQKSLEDKTRTVTVTQIPKQKKVPNLPSSIACFALLACIIALAVCVICLCVGLSKKFDFIDLVIAVVCFAVLCGLFEPFIKILPRTILYLSAGLSIKAVATCVLYSLKELRIANNDCKVLVKKEDKNMFMVALKNASAYEQNIFTKAISEFYAVISEPKYLIIKKRFKNSFDFRRSFACPSVISKKVENVQNFAGYLEKYFGKMQIVNTRNDDGMKMILKCRKHSYLTFNNENVDRKIKMIK